MKKDWATSGLDLHLELGRDQPGHGVRAGLETALREAVRTGRLGPGVRLPSSRALAADLGVARNTVAEAYGQLVAEGWLTAVQGSGTRVAGQAATSLARRGSPGPSRQSGPRGRAGPHRRPGSRHRLAQGRLLRATRSPGHRVPLLAAGGVTGPVGLPAGRLAGRGAPRAERRPQRGLRLRPAAGPPRAARTPWPNTWPGPAGCGPTPTGSWSATASARGWRC